MAGRSEGKVESFGLRYKTDKTLGDTCNSSRSDIEAKLLQTSMSLDIFHICGCGVACPL